MNDYNSAVSAQAEQRYERRVRWIMDAAVQLARSLPGSIESAEVAVAFATAIYDGAMRRWWDHAPPVEDARPLIDYCRCTGPKHQPDCPMATGIRPESRFPTGKPDSIP